MTTEQTLNYIVITATILLLYSCGTGMMVSKKDFLPIDNKFKATFENKSYLAKGRNYGNSGATILDFFELYKLKTDTIQFHFDNDNKLILTFNDSLSVRTEPFKGKFRKKGYYEIFIRNYKKEIPPLFPIIYSTRDIKRLRLGLTQENNLVIDNKWAKDGNIFILAGGGSERYRSYFRPILSGQ
jgi:hypothetical protein